MPSVKNNLDNFICFQFYKGWREVSSAYNNAFEEGVTLQNIFILQVLNEHSSLRVSEISKSVSLDPSAVSTLLSRMEKKSLVSREHDVLKDRRQVFISITAEGKQLLKNNKAIHDQYTESLFENINEADIATLEAIVQKLKKNRLK